jgi:hypothetical protein
MRAGTCTRRRWGTSRTCQAGRRETPAVPSPTGHARHRAPCTATTSSSCWNLAWAKELVALAFGHCGFGLAGWLCEERAGNPASVADTTRTPPLRAPPAIQRSAYAMIEKRPPDVSLPAVEPLFNGVQEELANDVCRPVLVLVGVLLLDGRLQRGLVPLLHALHNNTWHTAVGNQGPARRAQRSSVGRGKTRHVSTPRRTSFSSSPLPTSRWSAYRLILGPLRSTDRSWLNLHLLPLAHWLCLRARATQPCHDRA